VAPTAEETTVEEAEEATVEEAEPAAKRKKLQPHQNHQGKKKNPRTRAARRSVATKREKKQAKKAFKKELKKLTGTFKGSTKDVAGLCMTPPPAPAPTMRRA
jgi:hypothetical protein